MNLKENQKVISGFPGTGKSYYISRGEGSDYMPRGFASDSDSSKFDKSDFPNNYITHIKDLISKGTERIFVSSHKEVRDAMVLEGIPFTLVYPKMELKDECLKRYTERGSPDSFIKLISDNWESWITELENQPNCEHVQLNSNQFMYDLF